MAEQFDPYYTWLGIPPKDQPANYYRLLGLADFESNLDVIENAADRQMTHVRSFAGGKHSDESQRLLNEISAAKVCLLSPARKAEYDRALPGPPDSGPKRKVRKAQPLEADAAPEPRPRPKPRAAAEGLGIPQLDTGETSAAAALPQRRGQPKWVLPAALGGGGLIVLIVIIAVAMNGGGEDEVAENSRPAPRRPNANKPPVSSAPGAKTPGENDPVTPPPLWNTPPNSEPPNSEPPNSEPPNLEPPNLEPPNLEPPVTEPSEPPLVRPPTSEPPASEPPVPPAEPPRPESPPAVASRRPIPADAEVQDKIRAVQEIFADEYATAVTPELKAALAQSLLGNAAKTGSRAEASDLYALLSEARTLALAGGDAALALDAADLMAARFEVDMWTLKPETLQEAAKSAKSVAARLDTAMAAGILAEEAFADEKYDLAIELLRLASAQALQAKDRGLAKQAADRRKEVERVLNQYKRFQAAEAQLAADPADAAAQLTMGKHLCFLRGAWEAGIPHLVQGSNEELAELAQADQAAPVAGEEMLALADRWSQWAETASGDDKNGGLIRAQYWYLQSLLRLTGIRKSRAVKRLADLAGEIRPIIGRDGLKLPWLEGQVGELRVVAAHPGEIDHLMVSPNGRLALTAEDNGARLWDLATGNRLGEIAAPDYTITSVALAPDGRHVFAGTYDDRVVVLDARTGAAKGRIRTPDSVYALALSSDGKRLLWVCSYEEPNVGIWDIAANRPLAAFHCPDSPNCAAFSPDGRKAAIGCDNGIRLFDLGSKQQVTELSTDGSYAYAVCFSPNGRYLASTAGGELRLWDARRGSRIAILEDEYLSSSTLSFTRDGKRLLAADGRELLAVGVPDLAVDARIELPASVRSHITNVVGMPDPRGAVVTTGDGKLRLLRLPDAAVAPR